MRDQSTAYIIELISYQKWQNLARSPAYTGKNGQVLSLSKEKKTMAHVRNSSVITRTTKSILICCKKSYVRFLESTYSLNHIRCTFSTNDYFGTYKIIFSSVYKLASYSTGLFAVLYVEQVCICHFITTILKFFMSDPIFFLDQTFTMLGVSPLHFNKQYLPGLRVGY